MRVISFLNPKGGSGKTTAVINVSTAMSRAGYNIAVVDTDPQMSLTTWSKSGKATFDVFTAASEKDVYGIRKDLAEYDFAIIDGAGSLSVITSAAVMVSDLVIIPVTPSPLDFSAAGSVVTVLEAQAYSRKVEARFLITRKVDMATMLGVLKESIRDTGVKSFRTAITQRQIYVKSILDGDSVFESSDGSAKGEIEILTKEIISLF
ncbi:ParA family protein [Salmonella enterica]|nr:ParA family protein [Salmonella enterica subsp. diarizonae]ECF5951468.1 ParA family protein [Salmonella enterica subsp. diarizonae]EEO7837077.1 ParA family protein [Salmonella enterica]